ncbi:radical SAM additional 4Fe4S-binding SPASM domain protein, partial [Vibrio parahaemolyticus EKP-028]|jgi:hypothetical protein
MRCA